jgi:Asp/Glu/hydantoin racemase
MKTVFAVHTAMPMVEPTKALFAEHLPGVRLINCVDDSLIQDVIRAGSVPEAVAERLRLYYQAAVRAGADVIFNTCSSVGEVAVAARQTLPIPLVQIDEAMAGAAVHAARSIGVLATLPTTLEPTIRLLRRQADAAGGESIEIVAGLADGAFEALIGGDPARHDQLILQTAERLAGQVEALVLAQGSMARMEKQLAERTGRPVFSSPLLGVLNVKSVLESRG